MVQNENDILLANIGFFEQLPISGVDPRWMDEA
jgi:hypothetical protein